MVVVNMDGPARDQMLKLMDEKDKIEEEIKQLSAVLETNNVGLSEDLVDRDGFPRSDIDVYQVRHARHRIICLQNDHKALMKQIEMGLIALHSGTSGSIDPANFQSGSSSSQQVGRVAASPSYTNGQAGPGAHPLGIALSNRTTPKPIAKVNFVSPGSPAETAGIMLDDKILEFGSINSNNFSNVTQIGELVQHSVNTPILVKVIRGPQKANLNVTLIPKTWSGRGLLGCNIIPV